VANVSFYENGWFKGMWVFGGVGLLQLKASLSGGEASFSSILVSAGSGWRWQWDSGINFGFAVGLNYMSKVKTPAVPLDASNLLPSILMDFGFSF
jgi:hypothetical protein